MSIPLQPSAWKGRLVVGLPPAPFLLAGLRCCDRIVPPHKSTGHRGCGGRKPRAKSRKQAYACKMSLGRTSIPSDHNMIYGTGRAEYSLTGRTRAAYQSFLRSYMAGFSYSITNHMAATRLPFFMAVLLLEPAHCPAAAGLLHPRRLPESHDVP